MNTWGALQSRIREELDDPAEPFTWSEDLLFYWLQDALADYSLHNPLEKVTDLTDKTGASYTLPVDLLAIKWVENPQGTFLSKRESRPNVRFRARGPKPRRYWMSNNKLMLELETADTVQLTYNGLHSAPTDVDNTTFELTVPLRDFELLSLYVRAKAYGRMRGKQSNLDRFTLGSGDRDDNPVQPEVDDLMNEYRTKIAERYSGGVITLFRS